MIASVHTQNGLRAILLGKERSFLIAQLRIHFPEATESALSSSLHNITGKLLHFLEKPTERYEEKLDIQGTPFQKAVWKAMQDIAPGKTTTYTELASTIGHPKACRATANACGANPLALVIPCHRVLSKRGLGGYHWGTALKKKLLQREKALVTF